MKERDKEFVSALDALGGLPVPCQLPPAQSSSLPSTYKSAVETIQEGRDPRMVSGTTDIQPLELSLSQVRLDLQPVVPDHTVPLIDRIR
jgi:hypothetical protein